MTVICPTITANELGQYKLQMEYASGLTPRVHIDLMDGNFAPSVSPKLDQIWWPEGVVADIHLMYKKPMDYLSELIKLRPHMVIIHNEADVHHMHFVAELHKENIFAGLAVLQDTPIENAYQIMHSFDQVLVFSGNLGFHGGIADLDLLGKVKKIKEHHPDAEIAWDGGVNEENIKTLVDGGVDVLNVGGYIQNSPDPQAAYATLLSLV